ncbi:hypothetical protein CPB84DRAFT_1488604 [Gymnopilus junonius]|uniref:F-box domain-containing protein n=1 Tax=Gymnopilus junonius TaxID=109634 RepID=A0A9P5TJB7_GYMJU|nr:hypothetical protein CPB84DRAFT_1488604 [Gymnopilus junonius]
MIAIEMYTNSPAEGHVPALDALTEPSGIIHQIPTEILSEIFLFTTVPSEGDSEDLDVDLMSNTPIISRKVKTSPFPLSQVCRRWRDIVIDTKAMWKSVAIVNPNEHQLYRLQLWMERVRDHPLEVAIFLQYNSYPGCYPSPRQWESIRVGLLPLWGNLRRWTTLYLDSDGYVPPIICEQMRALAKFESPTLKKAIISIDNSRREVEELWISLNNIKNLETLHFNSDHIYYASRRPNPGLRAFQFGPYYDDQRVVSVNSNPMVRIITPFSNIEELSIDTGEIERQENWQGDEDCHPIALQHLRS